MNGCGSVPYEPAKCGAVGVLTVGGRAVAELVCVRDFGHGDGDFPRIMSEPGTIPTVYQFEPTPHRAVIEWTDEAIVELPDADLLDPGEVMDVDVPFGNPDARPCQLCGFPCDVDGH